MTITNLDRQVAEDGPIGPRSDNAAWLACGAISHNLLRAAAHLAGGAMARAREASVRTRLASVPSRVVRSARRTRLRLPRRWPWASHWQRFVAAVGLTVPGATYPPAALTS